MEYAEVARATSERGEVLLRERRDPTHPEVVLELRVNGVYVMDSHETGSERELARIALQRVERPEAVVVGGLGLGFTLREVLADHRVRAVTVVEIEDALVRWMRDGTVPHGPAALADDRLRVVVSDVRVAMAEAAPATYDLVLLDVDNGPGYLVHEDNAAVYAEAFLAEVARVLRPRGAVAVWSASEAPDLAEALRTVFGAVESISHEVTLRSRGPAGSPRTEHYWLYLARVTSAP